MKFSYLQFFGLFAGAVMSVSSFAQASPESEATIDDLKVAPIRIPALQEVNGTPFFSPDYQNATIRLKDNRYVPDMPVKFNILNNAVMVQMDGQELKLESFKTVFYDEKSAEGTVKHIEFAMGFPEIDKHNDRSVYLLLASGTKLQLLKYITQKVEDASTLGDYSRKELVKTEQLYLYVPGKEMKRIKASKKDITEALPELAAKIEEVSSANNLKLKTEAEIISLVEALNNK
ncbi:MAG TPA: hypothetical protein VFV31_07100 [Chitinophagaceae bacterium]|nr:hypothetical protein [Chitinophagaceae bacterium]